MKKFLILLLAIFVACGPSEEEIQSQIDEAVNQALEQASTESTTSSTSSTTTSTSTSTSTTSTTTTTTTTVAPIASKTLFLNCPDISEMTEGSNFKSGFVTTFGDNPKKITVSYQFNNLDPDYVVLDSKDFSNWDKGIRYEYYVFNTTLTSTYFYYKMIVTVEDGLGSHSSVCKTGGDINDMPPKVELLSCPKEVMQGETLAVNVKIYGTTSDVSYYNWTLLTGSLIDKNLTISDPETVPKINYWVTDGITWEVQVRDQEYNISTILEVYDTQGRVTKIACGTRAKK